MLKTLYMGTNEDYAAVDASKQVDRPTGQNFVYDVPNGGDVKHGVISLILFSHHAFTGNPNPLCQPNLTYTKKDAASKFNATEDEILDASRWSVNSTDTSHLMLEHFVK